MNFLNSTILFGLGAAALPVIIHLFFRRRARDEAFPSIRLLEKMKTDRIRRLRLKQIIVLLLRTLIIILIVLAFARPALRSVFRRNARTAAVIVIDSSASMQYIHNGEMLLHRAVRKAREILDMLERDDSAAIILSDATPQILGPGMTMRKKDLAKSLETVDVLYAGGNPTASFSEAVSLLNVAGTPNRELYYLTDGSGGALPDSLGAATGSLRLYVLHVGPENHESPVLENIELVEHLITPGAPVTFRAQGQASASDDEVTVELFVDGERKSRVQSQKRSAGSIEADFIYTPEAPGWYSVYASVGDGRYEAGETRRLILHVPPPVTVLVVGKTQQDLYFLRKVLEPDPDHSMFTVRSVTADELTQENLAFADVIVLSSVPSLPEQLYSSIRTAVVDRGAGLIVFPPENMDTRLYDNGIFRDILPLSVEKRVALSSEKGGFAQIDKFTMNHPILRGVSSDGNFRKPEVRSYVIMRPAGMMTVIARFSDGTMAIGEAPCGRGRAVMFGVDATSSASELPVTGIFVPLFIRTVQYLSGTFVTGGRYDCGEPVNEFISDIQPSTPVSLKPENGPALLVPVTYVGNGAELKDIPADRPGFYSVFSGDKELKRFSVDISRSEIIFQRAGAEAMKNAFKKIRWKVLGDDDNLVSFVTGDRYGTELFSLFLALALVAIITEMLISRKL